MDFLTLVGYGITALIGIIGGYAIWGKAGHVLRDVATLINTAMSAIEDGNITKAELTKVIEDAKAVIDAFKG